MRGSPAAASRAGTCGRRQAAGARGLLGFVELHSALRLCVCVVCASAALFGAAGQALGATGHAFFSSLSEAPPGTKLLGPGSVALDRSTGEVFVGGLESGYVDVYGSSGKFETRFGEGVIEAAGIAVDESSGDVYVAAPFEAAVLVYEPDGKGGYRRLGEWFGQGTPGAEFGEVMGVAVDNSKGPSAGDVYVVEAQGVGVEGGVVDVFRPKPNPEHPEEVAEGAGEEGEYVKRLSGPKLEEPNGVAVDASTGRVLVADSAKGAIYAYSDTGGYEEKLTGKGSPYGSFKGKEEVGNVAGVAVDEGSGDIYVAESERHAVSQYSSSGEWEGWITDGQGAPLGEPRGVALTPAGEVYVADTVVGVVDRFGAGVVVPGVETGKVAKSGVTRTTALLGGVVNGDGKAAGYRVQYGESEALGSETATEASGMGEETVSVKLSGLHAGRTYFARLAAENENGVNYGVVREFQTPPAVEALVTGAVKNLEPESATVMGSLKRGGLQTHYYFQYGTSTAYGTISPEPPGEVPAGKEEKEEKQEKTLESNLSSLSANTTYHYRFVAENSFGITYGGDQTLTTSGPPRITSEATTGIGHEDATIHARVDPDQIATSYHFEYGETTAYGSEVPVGGQSIGSGSEPVAVSASLSELKLGVTYHFRVVAENTAGTTTSPDQRFTTVAAAPIDATYATEVGATEATLHTQVNPLGNDTHYYFQYGTQSCQASPGACTNVPAAPGEDIGSGQEDVAKSIALSELAAHTTYYYRVLDANSLGTTEGAEHTFTTQEARGSFALPDNRAWEMVTPPDKGGAPVEALTREGGLILAAEDGSALTYVVDGALGEEAQSNRSPEWQQVLATRTAKGWSSQDIATPSSKAQGITAGHAPEYQFFTPDLSSALVEPAGAGAEPPLAPGVTQATIYLRDDTTGTFLPLVDEANVAPGTKFGAQLRFLGATPDLSHVVIASAVALTGAGSAPGLYEWSAGQLQLVSLLPGGAAASEAELGYSHVQAHAISSDGSRIIWTRKEENSGRGHLYLYNATNGKTLQLDAAQGVVEPSKGSAQFQGASSDGSHVFFTDRERLTPDSTAEPTGFHASADLYECEITEENGKPACDLQDLTVDHNEGEHAAVQNFILGASEDGSSVYLVAQGVLAGNENGNGETPEATKNNLYDLHYDGTQWTTTFIAVLSGEDSTEWEGNDLADTAFLTARASPHGRYLAFMSAASPTGYDNLDANPAAKGVRDEEVYLYDSATASLRCVSCNPTGARPAGVLDANESGEGLGLLVDRRKVWLGHWLAGNIPGWTAQSLTSALFQSRYLSDEGRLYFNSPDNLVPAAENAREDVYEYEPAGVGSCQSPSGGCVALISGGSSSRESAFLEATPNGSDVFFVTESRLLPQDTDTAFDIYDARECTELSPCLTPPELGKPGCGGTPTCRPAQPSLQISGGPAGTATVSGAGNIVFQTPPAKQEGEAHKSPASLIQAQKLAKALKICRKQHAHSKRKREACERSARKSNKHKANKADARKAGERSGARGR